MLLLIIVIYKNGIFLFSSFVTPQLYKTVFAISTGNCWLFIYFQTHQYCIFLRILIECFADSIVYESFSRIKCSSLPDYFLLHPAEPLQSDVLYSTPSKLALMHDQPLTFHLINHCDSCNLHFINCSIAKQISYSFPCFSATKQTLLFCSSVSRIAFSLQASENDWCSISATTAPSSIVISRTSVFASFSR